MEGRENSKVQHPFGEQEKYTSPYYSHPSFSKLCPIMFSTMEFNEVKNAGAEANRGNSSNSFTPNNEDSFGYSEDHSCDKSDRDSCSEADGDASDEEVSLDELLFEEKARKKIELLAAIVGVDTTEPAIVLTEVVRVLKVLNTINQYN
ncbi:hypothetical protein SESBI_40515 [Sesbania bispinosa]|nr:hypothetical protein SESBI_40515 [Sesbania bispinosa]